MSTPSETTALVGGGKKSISKAKMRSSVAAVGGSEGIGTFQIKTDSKVGKSFSIAAGASGPSVAVTPTELGKQELYEKVPFTAVAGLGKKQRAVSAAFANFAADIDLQSSVGQTLSDDEKAMRKSALSGAVYDELQFESSVLSKPLIMAVIVSSLCNFLVGYNTAVLNNPESVIFPGHSTGVWALAVAALPGGSPFGAAYAGKVVESKGRRGAFLLCIWIFFIGGLVQSVAWSMWVIVVSRIILSIAVGMSSVLVPLYLGEIAPPTLRGAFGTMASFALVCGILIANLMAFPFTTEKLWRVQTGVTALIAFLQLIFSSVLIESPLWLLQKDSQSFEAREAIKKLRGLRTQHEVETEVGYFLSGLEAQGDAGGDGEKKDVIGTIMADPLMAKRFVAVITLQVAQQFCGINAVFFYSTSFFDGIIDNPLAGTTLVGFINVVATFIALLIMDKYSRKVLLLWSNGGMFLSVVVIVMALLGYFENMYALFAVNAYVFFFEIGMGPIPWLIAPEMFEGSFVPVVMSICSQVNFSCSFIVGFVFPYMNKYLGAFSFGPFGAVIFLTFVYSMACLPSASEGEDVETLKQDIVKRKSEGITYEPNAENASKLQNEWQIALAQLEAEEGEEGEGVV